jgi:DNA-binding NtrC family response regulator
MAPRILIVDDDESVRDVISVLLKEEGYNCVVASGAEMALDLAAAEETPLVISDMKMPGRDGLWLLENFRARYPDTSVIMLTGYGDTEAAVDSLRKGAVDYLLKPPRLTDLIRAIERALAKRRIEMARRRYQKKLERKVRDRTTELRAALQNIANTYQNTLSAWFVTPLPSPPSWESPDRSWKRSAAARCSTTSARSACRTRCC